MSDEIKVTVNEDNDYILEVNNLVKHYPIKAGVMQRTVGHVKSVDGVSFKIKRGQTFGLVGESGCGKTTTGRTILRLTEPTSGEAILNGKDIFAMNKKQMREMRPQVQMIFQDPYASLDPRMPIGEIIGEAVREHNIVPKEKYREYILQVMRDCGLRDFYIDRYPHEFSGGQRQRIGIARALAIEPEFLICDEPISALDVSIQSQIINLLIDLQKRLGLTYLFIAHDLDIVRYISDRIVVMYLGHVVEIGESNEVYSNALHPYSQALLSAVPIPDPELEREKKRIILEGDIPSPINLPKGCPFAGRCHYAKPECSESMPELKEVSAGHFVACHNINK